MRKTPLLLLFATATLLFSVSAKADTDALTFNSYVSYTTSLTGSASDNSNASPLRDYRVEKPRVARKSRFREQHGDNAFRSPLDKRLARRVIRLFNPFSGQR
jgi:hypothetical protein